MIAQIIEDMLLSVGRIVGWGIAAAVAAKLVKDIAWYRFNLPTRDQTQTTKNCYDWFEHYLPNVAGESIDYSEGIFDFEHNPQMTLPEATRHKYEYIFNQLELKSGMTLLDAGCGSGVWMDYCRRRGIITIGLTLSPEQAKVVRKKGLDARVMDYRKLNNDFLRRFDRITALGSTEHMCTSMGMLNGEARKRSIETLANVWDILRQYLKPDGRIFVTTLTVNEKATWAMMDYVQGYVMDQHYGGYYPLMSDINNKIAPKVGLEVTNVTDHTASYHWSSMRDPKHFGYYKIDWTENTWDKMTYIFKSAIKSPFQFPFHWLYQGLDTWMWQFGGPQKTPLTDEQVQKAPAQLKYFMLTPVSMFTKHRTIPTDDKYCSTKKQVRVANY